MYGQSPWKNPYIFLPIYVSFFFVISLMYLKVIPKKYIGKEFRIYKKFLIYFYVIYFVENSLFFLFIFIKKIVFDFLIILYYFLEHLSLNAVENPFIYFFSVFLVIVTLIIFILTYLGIFSKDYTPKEVIILIGIIFFFLYYSCNEVLVLLYTEFPFIFGPMYLLLFIIIFLYHFLRNRWRSGKTLIFLIIASFIIIFII